MRVRRVLWDWVRDVARKRMQRGYVSVGRLMIGFGVGVFLRVSVLWGGG